MDKYNEIWTIDKMIMMGIVKKCEHNLVPGVQEYDVISDCVVRAWHNLKDAMPEGEYLHFDNVRYVYEKDNGTVGYATSQIELDLPINGWQDQVKFEVLQTIQAPR